jgi:long-chain acyl-CoA synthetase
VCPREIVPGLEQQLTARIRKAAMPRGYLDDPVASSAFRDGWFYPRDLLSRTENGPLVFHGRLDDTMILNGINIFPSAIEDTLESHPDVREAVAYAVKSRIHGDIPVAAVILKDGGRKGDASHLIDHCRRILGMRAPRRVVVVEHIPRNSAGKPLRRELARDG